MSVKIIRTPDDEIPNNVKHLVMLVYGWARKKKMKIVGLNKIFLRQVISDFTGYLLAPMVMNTIWSGHKIEEYSVDLSEDVIRDNETVIDILEKSQDVIAEGLDKFLEKEAEKHNANELEAVKKIKYLIDQEILSRLKYYPGSFANSELVNAFKVIFESKRLLEDKSTTNINIDEIGDDELIAAIQKANYAKSKSNARSGKGNIVEKAE